MEKALNNLQKCYLDRLIEEGKIKRLVWFSDLSKEEQENLKKLNDYVGLEDDVVIYFNEKFIR
jgi:hypothetical protein